MSLQVVGSLHNLFVFLSVFFLLEPIFLCYKVTHANMLHRIYYYFSLVIESARNLSARDLKSQTDYPKQLPGRNSHIYFCTWIFQSRCHDVKTLLLSQRNASNTSELCQYQDSFAIYCSIASLIFLVSSITMCNEHSQFSMYRSWTVQIFENFNFTFKNAELYAALR